MHKKTFDESVCTLDEFAENIKWERIAPSVEIKHAAHPEDEERLSEIGKAMAKRLQ